MENCFALKGNIIWSRTPQALVFAPQHYAVCENGACAGVFAQLPERFASVRVEDLGQRLILPGFVDLHLHAPQYRNAALGYDMELLEWLDALTIHEEARYGEEAYARSAYHAFTQALLCTPTTRACVFATAHTQATLLLMEMLEQSGLETYVGRVNMDRNAPPELAEKDAAWALEQTEDWIERSLARFHRTKPILTPRFAPSCTPELLAGLGALRKRYQLPVQSHLCETIPEIEWVRSLFPDCADYASVYERFGLLSGDTPTIMAHCVYLSDCERQRVKNAGVFIAHCPSSNTNVSSGVAPVRSFLDDGMRLGLGTDVAGGEALNLLREASHAVSVSKLRRVLLGGKEGAVSMDEALYLATRGGGAFFGSAGAFEPGFVFDAVVFDDERLRPAQELTLRQRLEKLFYLGDEREVQAKYVGGRRVL